MWCPEPSVRLTYALVAAVSRTIDVTAHRSGGEGLPFITLETVASETLARAATSAMVCGRMCGSAATSTPIFTYLGVLSEVSPAVLLRIGRQPGAGRTPGSKDC